MVKKKAKRKDKATQFKDTVSAELKKQIYELTVEKDHWRQKAHFFQAKLAQYDGLPGLGDYNQKQAELDTMRSENTLLEQQNRQLKRQLVELKRLTEVPEDGQAFGV